MRLPSFLCALLVLVPTLAFAQAAPSGPPTVVRGIIQSLHGDELVVAAQNGHKVALVVPASARITSTEKRSLADIKPGDFVGSAAIKGRDGKLHAQEVHIFPESMRGTGEGHRPMGPNPARSMTNATVAAVSPLPAHSMTNATVASVKSGAQGKVMTLKYKGGENQIEVGPNVPVVTFVPGDRSLLQPGAAVVVFAAKGDHGLVARMINAEKNGVKPMP